MHIPLTRGLFALIDDEDADDISQFRWHALESANNPGRYYAYRRARLRPGPSVTLYMHRAIMKPPIGFHVDHINHNRLDNRRCNLRIATQAQNNSNAIYSSTALGRRGVYEYRPGHFTVRASRQGIVYMRRGFTDSIQAALIYDAMARILFGEFAATNFPPSEGGHNKIAEEIISAGGKRLARAAKWAA